MCVSHSTCAKCDQPPRFGLYVPVYVSLGVCVASFLTPPRVVDEMLWMGQPPRILPVTDPYYEAIAKFDQYFGGGDTSNNVVVQVNG